MAQSARTALFAPKVVAVVANPINARASIIMPSIFTRRRLPKVSSRASVTIFGAVCGCGAMSAVSLMVPPKKSVNHSLVGSLVSLPGDMFWIFRSCLPKNIT